MKTLICLVTDSEGKTDLIEVNDLSEVSSKWIDCRVLREI